MKVSFATAADLREFYGEFPTMHAVCAKKDGKVVGVVGLVLEPLQNRFFSEFRLPRRELAKPFWRAARLAMQFVMNSKRPVVAIAQHDHGHKNLTRLGFEHVEGEYYQWRG